MPRHQQNLSTLTWNYIAPWWNAAHNSVLSMVFDSFIETLRNSALDVITDVAARDPNRSTTKPLPTEI